MAGVTSPEISVIVAAFNAGNSIGRCIESILAQSFRDFELLILDTKVAGENMGDAMDMVENMKGEVMVVSSEHEGGKQLESLGGMAAILRYEIA